MAASTRFRALGLGHSAVQRDRQPPYGRVAEAELEAQTLRNTGVCSSERFQSICLVQVHRARGVDGIQQLERRKHFLGMHGIGKYLIPTSQAYMYIYARIRLSIDYMQIMRGKWSVNEDHCEMTKWVSSIQMTKL